MAVFNNYSRILTDIYYPFIDQISLAPSFHGKAPSVVAYFFSFWACIDLREWKILKEQSRNVEN